MCGLVAMVTKNRHGFSQNNMNFFDHLLFIDTVRGEDSTGVFLVNNIGNVKIAKAAIHGPDFVNTKEYKDLKTDAVCSGWAMVGHNRKATRGNVTDENAHPFWVEDKIVLSHNGTMFGDHKKHADVEVDSHAIAHVLAEEADVQKALKKVNAAYALIWYNIAKKQLHFIRNSQRPLAWMETHNAFYFASEKDMLEYVAKRTNTEITSKGDDGIARAWELTPSSLDIWQLCPDKSTEVKSVDIDTNYEPPVMQMPRPFKQTQQHHGVPKIYLYDEGESEDATDIPHTVLTPSDKRMLQVELDAANAIDRAKTGTGVPVVVQLQAPQAIVPKPLPVWAPEAMYQEWCEMRDSYKQGYFIRVQAKDYLPDPHKEGKIWMTGTTVDDKQIFTVFPIEKSVFDRITAANSTYMKDGRALFSVEINTIGWRRNEQHPMPIDFNVAEGHPWIVGSQGKIIISLPAANA